MSWSKLAYEERYSKFSNNLARRSFEDRCSQTRTIARPLRPSSLCDLRAGQVDMAARAYVH